MISARRVADAMSQVEQAGTSSEGSAHLSRTRFSAAMTYDSDKAHPRRHDIGVIHLDEAIKLDSYPRLVGDKALDGLQATRLRGATWTAGFWVANFESTVATAHFATLAASRAHAT